MRYKIITCSAETILSQEEFLFVITGGFKNVDKMANIIKALAKDVDLTTLDQTQLRHNVTSLEAIPDE